MHLHHKVKRWECPNVGWHLILRDTRAMGCIVLSTTLYAYLWYRPVFVDAETSLAASWLPSSLYAF